MTVELRLRPATTRDVHAIKALVAPLAHEGVLVIKETVAYYEGIQEFLIAELVDTDLLEAGLTDADPGAAQGPGRLPGNDGAGTTDPGIIAPGGGDRVADGLVGDDGLELGQPSSAGEHARIVGCGALHVMWQDLAEIRTLATDPRARGRGVGGRIVEALLGRARAVGVERVFCLTFEVEFFRGRGFGVMQNQQTIDHDVFAELLRSHDEGVAEFLDLARVKPNTLGNTRMILTL